MADDFENVENEEGAPEWIVTFADMMSLLLTFFILLLSFANTDAEKFKAAAESLREAFSFTALPIPGKTRPMSTDIPKSPLSESGSPDYIVVQQVTEREARLLEIKRHIDSYISQERLETFIQTELSDKGLAIVNADPLSFPEAEANLSSNAVKYLEALLPAIANSDFDVIIEGHTDDRPINTPEFITNWELSTARASRFARFLIDHGVSPERLSVRGFAEFRPVAPNNTEENRAKNRRIEILLGYESCNDQLTGSSQ